MQDQSFNQIIAADSPKTPDPDAIPNSIGKLMRPSASQLLYGIARDVRKTTSSIEGTDKPTDHMLGGLNLLATVSKYMNAKDCNEEQWAFKEGSEKGENSTSNLLLPRTVVSVSQGYCSQQISTISNTKFVSSTVTSSQPLLRPVQITSPSSSGHIDNIALFTNVKTTPKADDMSALPSSINPINSLLQYEVPSTSALGSFNKLLPYLPKPVSECDDDNNNDDLNFIPVGQKVVYKPSMLSALTAAANIQTPSMPTTSSATQPEVVGPLKIVSNEETSELNTVQSQHMNTATNAVFTTLNPVPLTDVGIAAESSSASYCPNEMSNTTMTVIQDKNINTVSSASNHLQLRSISSVSGKTYIILAASPKGSYVHNLQPFFKETEPKAGGKVVVGSPIPLS